MATARVKKYGNRNEPTPSPMLKTSEACRILCIHSNTLRRWSEQGIITAYRIGPRGDRRFRREDVAALLIKTTQHKERRLEIN
jgi:excisionase family DNA binding protein